MCGAVLGGSLTTKDFCFPSWGVMTLAVSVVPARCFCLVVAGSFPATPTMSKSGRNVSRETFTTEKRKTMFINRTRTGAMVTQGSTTTFTASFSMRHAKVLTQPDGYRVYLGEHLRQDANYHGIFSTFDEAKEICEKYLSEIFQCHKCYHRHDYSQVTYGEVWHHGGEVELVTYCPKCA